MALATYLMSRGQYEARCRERLESLNPDDPERVARALLHRYPATSEQAAAELQTRGLDAAAEALPSLARNIGLEPRVIGRSHVWYPDDVDVLAEVLDGANRLTHPAMWRRARGVSVAQEIAIEREVNARRQARLDAVGKTVGCEGGDVWEIVGDVLSDPLDWSDEDAERAVELMRASMEGARS